MNDTTVSLARCHPLTDSVRLALRFVWWNMTMMPVIMVVLSEVLSHSAGPGMGKGGHGIAFDVYGVYAVIWLASTGTQYCAFRLLLRESAEAPTLCLLLRAFRADAKSDKMRAWLKAALGPKYKLSGIRPPRERTSGFSKLLSPLATGLSYAGSRQFEMEAGNHNWLARLLATFAETRFVFIDVREMTKHVLDEVTLAWRVFSAEKCIFIVNEHGVSGEGETPGDSSDARWRSWLVKTLTNADLTANAASLKLLCWPSDDNADSSAFCAAVQRHLETVPAADTVIEDEHLTFVRQRVPPEKWDTRFYETDAFLIAASIVSVSAVAFLWGGLQLTSKVRWLPAALLFVAIQSLFWRAWIRAIRQRRQAALINPAGPPSALRVWGAAGWTTLYLVIWALVAAIALSAPLFLHRADTRKLLETTGRGDGRPSK